MRTFKSIIAVTLLIVVAASCNKKLDVTGVWTCTITERHNGNRLYSQMFTLTFTNDGEFTDECIIQAGMFNLTTTGKGTYKISNDTIFKTLNEWYNNGNKMPFDSQNNIEKLKILKADKDSLIYSQDGKITRMKRK